MLEISGSKIKTLSGSMSPNTISTKNSYEKRDQMID